MRFIVSRGDGSELFEFGKEVLDQMARFVEVLVVLALLFPVGFGWDDGGLARLLQLVQHTFVRVVAFIGDYGRRRQRFQQRVSTVQIAGLTGGQVQAGRIAESVHGRMDFGAATAPTQSNGLIAPFLSAPALC